ncbi:hypothetical protein Fcan01_17064 [Folsomia candida]|uniref:Uncharacterized protein n=1 Tax=Folsomia candida TaxID=158441 RepID=A0A226DTF4_FOLCA|nr:hypothetical protein Fcan01_17064 [Folsomia candida]
MFTRFYILASFSFISFFDNCEIHFIHQKLLGDDNANKHFGAIRNKNLYTPLTIQLKYLNGGQYNVNHSQEQLYSPPGKSGRIKVTFMNLIISISDSEHDRLHHPPPPHYQLSTATRATNPNYAFILVTFPIPKEYYLNYAAETSQAILVFVNLSNPKEVVLPCIVCTSESLIPVISIPSLSDLATLWETTNTKNLQGGVMLNLLRSKTPGQICGFSLGQFNVTDNTVDCTLKLLSESYNFTLFPTTLLAMDQIDGKKVIIGKMDFRFVFNEELLAQIESEQLLIYDVELEVIDFVIVTQFPHAENSICGVFTPFEVDIWLSIMISCVGISLILQFQGKGLPNNFSAMRSVQDFIMVHSILLGQAIADEIIRKVKNKQVSRPLLAVWFFVCYILMENLYQGSIYSDLTVMYPPQVPKTARELVASNMTIITTTPMLTHSITLKGPEITSLLKTSIIPEVQKKNFGESYNNFINKLNSKMEYIHGGNGLMSMIKNMSNSLIIGSNETSKWITTKGTFAIMDMVQYLELYVDSLHIFGKRLVIQNNPDAAFRFCVVAYGRRNFISPEIQAFLRRLAETGILVRFSFLEKSNYKMQFIKQLGAETYSRFVAKLSSNFKMVTTYHESGIQFYDEQALGALSYVLALCSVIVSIATVIFVWELVSGYAKVRKKY